MTNTIGLVERTARISEDGVYRYTLDRVWRKAAPRTVFLMLNPSTADGTVDDATIRRCVGYARRWGHGGIRVINLYALRSRDPAALWTHPDPVGPDNEATLIETARDARSRGHLVVAAWGANARTSRAVSVAWTLAEVGKPLACFGLTKAGHPLHPLMLRGDAPLIDFDASTLVRAERTERERRGYGVL